MSRSFPEAEGWLRLDDFLVAHEVAAVLAECDELLALPETDRRHRDKPAAGTRHLYELDDRSALIAEVVERPAIVDVVSQILGEQPERVETSYRCPQPTFGGQLLHADDVPKLHDGPSTVATAIIALTAFAENNGATRVVPGSHRRIDLQRHSGSLDAHPEEILLAGPAGTAFVFSGHVLHSGTPNRSNRERPALQVVWRTPSTRSALVSRARTAELHRDAHRAG